MGVRDVRSTTHVPATEREERFAGHTVNEGQHFEQSAARPAVLSRTGASRSVTSYPEPTKEQLDKITEELHPLSYAFGVAKEVENAEGQPVPKEFVSFVAEWETLKQIHAAGYNTLQEMIKAFSDEIQAA